MLNPKTTNKLRKLANDTSLPAWLRACLWVVLLASQLASVGVQLTHTSQFTKPGNELYAWGSGIFGTIAAIVIAVLGLRELRRAGLAAGKRGFARQIAHVLLRTFIFVLLPCMAITLLLVTWAILTHQPGFAGSPPAPESISL